MYLRDTVLPRGAGEGAWAYLTARCRAASAAPPGDWCNPSEPFQDRSSAAEDRWRTRGLSQRAVRGA